MSTFRTAAISGLVALPLVAGIATQPASAAHHAAGHHSYIIKMMPGKGNYIFNPATKTIKVGDTITWVDTTPMIHNIIGYKTALSKKYITRSSFSTKSYRVTFTKPGAYYYECTLHLPQMVGKLIVTK